MIEKVEIGNCLLYNGDCREVAEQIERTDHVITDPPYEAEAHSNQRKISTTGIKNDKLKFDAMDEILRAFVANKIVSVTKGWALIFCQVEAWHLWRKLLKEAGASGDNPMVWHKPDGAPRFTGIGPSHNYEMIDLVWCGKQKRVWNGGGSHGVLSVNKFERGDNVHQTVKPQALMTQLVAWFTNKDETVLDLFMGSGSTGVACASMDRKFIGVEKDPEYFDLSCRRIEKALSTGLFEGNRPYVRQKSRVIVDMFKGPEEIKVAKQIAPKQTRPIAERKSKEIASKQTKEIKTKFSMPVIEDDEGNSPSIQVKKVPYVDPFLFFHKSTLDAAQGRILKFDEDTWEWDSKQVLIMDVEVFENFFLVGFKNVITGKRIAIEMSDRCSLDKDKLKKLLKNRIITFNGTTFDVPILLMALRGDDCATLMRATKRIIGDNMRWWDVEREFSVQVPKSIDHIDLIEPSPAIRTSLKIQHARLSGKYVVDLPYEPGKRLSHHEMNVVTLYCVMNDLDATENIYNHIAEPLELRRKLSNQYKVDLRSKSDAQIGEAIFKNRIGRVGKATPMPTFQYSTPDFVSFESAQMKDVLVKLADTTFTVNSFSGKAETPVWLEGFKIRFGDMDYTMGRGGLHSTEERRALLSDKEEVLVDLDVAGHYPNIGLKLGLYPEAAGPKYIEVGGDMIATRYKSKQEQQVLEKLLEKGEIVTLPPEYDEHRTSAEGLKIATNGGMFGKLGSQYSFLYAPNILFAVTMGGQLSVIMLIERFTRAGIKCVSGNTDGVLVLCPRKLLPTLDKIVRQWEAETGFIVEKNRYKAIYNSSVNSYFALKENGKFKVKGPLNDPWSDKAPREMIQKNPQMRVLTRAICEYLKSGVSFEETIRKCTDPAMFVTVTDVKTPGGAVWRGSNLGKAIRYYWSHDGEAIRRANGNKVGKTDGAKPMMMLTDEVPADLDYEKYIAEAKSIAIDYAVVREKGLL